MEAKRRQTLQSVVMLGTAPWRKLIEERDELVNYSIRQDWTANPGLVCRSRGIVIFVNWHVLLEVEFWCAA
jgi:hypothetical protein